MALTQIQESTNDSTRLFTLNGIDYQKGLWQVFYTDRNLTPSGIDLTRIRVGLRKTDSNDYQIQEPVLVNQWCDGTGTPFTDYGVLIKALAVLVDFSPATADNNLYLGFSGQSGMNCITLGVNGGGDDSTNPKVLAWNDMTNSYVVADLNLYPFGERLNGVTDISGNNNLAFHTAKRIQEYTGKTIYMIFDAFSGVPISDWVGNGVNSVYWQTFLTKVTASQIPRLDAYFWKQGEGENSSNVNLGEDYSTNIKILISQINNLFPTRLARTSFVAYELADMFKLNDVFYSNNQYSKYISANQFIVATGRDLETLPDNVHLTGASVVNQAGRAASEYMALPKSTSKVFMETVYNETTDSIETIKFNANDDIYFPPKVGDEQVFRTTNVGNIEFDPEAGVTLISKNNHRSTDGVASEVRLIKTSANSYILKGDLKVSTGNNPLGAFYASDDFNSPTLSNIWTRTGGTSRIVTTNNRLEVYMPHTLNVTWTALQVAIKTNALVNSGLVVAQSGIQFENAIRNIASPAFGIIVNGTEGSISGARFITNLVAGEVAIQVQLGGANQYYFDTGIIATSMEDFKVEYNFTSKAFNFYHWNTATTSWDEIDAATPKVFDIDLGTETIDAYYTLLDNIAATSNDFGYFDNFILHNSNYATLNP